MTDPDGTEAVTAYYVVRIYRRRPCQDGERGLLVGVIEDAEGNQRSFQDLEALWQALAGERVSAIPPD